MDFSDFLNQIKKLQCQEKRASTLEYTELVVAKPHWNEMASVLNAYFGQPLKPQGQNSSRDTDQCAKPYGGVRKDQTLYFKKNETGTYAALLWPWGNGTSVTLKIIRS